MTSRLRQRARARACLARPVTEEEVYLLLFPVNKWLPPTPCYERAVRAVPRVRP